MKHHIAYLSTVLLLVLFTGCNKITSNAVAPVNPQAKTTNVNTTTIMNDVGIGAAWVYYSCQTGQTCFTTIDTPINTTVTACFSSPPVPGVYQLVSSTSLLSAGKAVLTVINPPNQTSGTSWYSASGNINVTTFIGGINATFTNITCLDNPGSLDSVIVSGQVSCL